MSIKGAWFAKVKNGIIYSRNAMNIWRVKGEET